MNIRKFRTVRVISKRCFPCQCRPHYKVSLACTRDEWVLLRTNCLPSVNRTCDQYLDMKFVTKQFLNQDYLILSAESIKLMFRSLALHWSEDIKHHSFFRYSLNPWFLNQNEGQQFRLQNSSLTRQIRELYIKIAIGNMPHWCFPREECFYRVIVNHWLK